MKNSLIDFYLTWVNDFLTVEFMANWYRITPEECQALINMGKKYHEERVERNKEILTRNTTV